MAELYRMLMKKGLMTIIDVPMRWREEVLSILVTENEENRIQ